jgi:Major tropism determinant N-terminal domain
MPVPLPLPVPTQVPLQGSQPWVPFMQFKRNTAAGWTTSNPILAANEFGWESNTNLFKIGNGVTRWTGLPYGGRGGGGSTGPTGATGADGLGFTTKGTWNPSGTYYRNDIVFDNNGSYSWISNVPGNSVSEPYIDTIRWQPIALQGPTGPTGDGGTGPTGPTGAAIYTAIIFDGGSSTTTYPLGPAFDCGTSV